MEGRAKAKETGGIIMGETEVAVSTTCDSSGTIFNKIRQTLYIGSPNDTRKLNDGYREKVKRWAREHMNGGYTWTEGKGYWGDNEEETIILTYLNTETIPIGHIRELSNLLEQQCIMVTAEEVTARFI